MRHQPPGLAANDERRFVFGSALEQAEQLFTSAATAGYASRPIALFYGLSQAGRAIAAASMDAGDDDWKLKGHGIGVFNLDDGPELSLLTVGDKGRGGSFKQLAPLLKSGTLPNPTPFGQLWRVIPDLLATPLDDSSVTPSVLFVNGFNVTEEMGGMRITGLPQNLEAAAEEQVADFFKSYPTLVGNEPHPDFKAPQVDHAGRTYTLRAWRWSTPEENDMRRLLNRITQPYRDDSERWSFPALGGDQAALHPLLAWWAILFALSMLARYEPASWTNHIDVDISPNAVPLETVLEQALDTCPRLILHAIQTVSK